MCRLLSIGLTVWPLILNAQVNRTTEGKRQEAEATADRIIARFYETLDFETVYKEYYVSGDLKSAEVEIIVNNFTQGGLGAFNSREKPQIDFSAKERAYLSLANFRWVSSAARITFDGDETKMRNDAEQAWIRYYEPINDKSTWPILTSQQLDERITSRFNGLASFFRRYVVQKNFRNEMYKARSLRVKETQPPESEKDLKQLFHISNDVRIYVARRERFYIYLIEQQGAFKMLSYTDRIRL